MASELLCPDQTDSATMLRRMKSIVAEGAALRALAIETGFCEDPANIPRRRYALVVGRVIEADGTRTFSHVDKVYRLDHGEAVWRDGLEFWVARFVPSLTQEDLGPLTNADAGDIPPDSHEGVFLEIARACIVPVQRVASRGDAIQWDIRPNEMIITIDGGKDVERVSLADDGSYA
jgi:hypothetical protein